MCHDLNLPVIFDLIHIVAHAQQMEGAKHGFFVFSKLFFTYMSRKNAANTHLVRFCGIFAAAQNFDSKGATKSAAKGKL